MKSVNRLLNLSFIHFAQGALSPRQPLLPLRLPLLALPLILPIRRPHLRIPPLQLNLRLANRRLRSLRPLQFALLPQIFSSPMRLHLLHPSILIQLTCPLKYILLRYLDRSRDKRHFLILLLKIPRVLRQQHRILEFLQIILDTLHLLLLRISNLIFRRLILPGRCRPQLPLHPLLTHLLRHSIIIIPNRVFLHLKLNSSIRRSPLLFLLSLDQIDIFS